MPDAHYTQPTLAALYDAECQWSQADDFYVEIGGSAPKSILDIGCGTGQLSTELASRGHNVTGVDPALPMLDIAEQRHGGDQVTWVCSDAEAFQTRQTFDIIMMTGHAFQVLAGAAQMLALFRKTHALLRPHGKFAFETRNPAVDWHDRWDNSRTVLTVNGQSVTLTRRVLEQSSDHVTFDTNYDFGDKVLTSHSRLYFPTKAAVLSAASQAGLTPTALFGDWDTSALTQKSDEMIFMFEKC